MRLLFYLRLFFGDLDKSFSLGYAHASMAMRSFNHDFIVHDALELVRLLLDGGTGVLQRFDISRAFGHQGTGTGVFADLFTELLVIARCGIAARNDNTIF